MDRKLRGIPIPGRSPTEGGLRFIRVDQIPLAPHGVYRITATLGSSQVVGEFVYQFGSTLVFRNLDTNHVDGFRTAWLIEWEEIAAIEGATEIFYDFAVRLAREAIL